MMAKDFLTYGSVYEFLTLDSNCIAPSLCVCSPVYFDGSSKNSPYSLLWMKRNDAIHNSDVLVIVVQRQVGRSEVNQVREISRIELTCPLEVVYGVSPATLTAVHRSS